MMKIIVIFLAIVSLSWAHPKNDPDGCKYCVEGTKALLQKLRTPAQFVIIERIILGKLCDSLDDPAGCKKGVTNWWPKIVDIIFTDDAAEPICKQLSGGACNAFTFNSKWSCDTCLKDLKAVSDIARSKDAAKLAMESLNGEAFCQSKDLGLSADQIKTCQGYVNAFIEPALKAIFDQIDIHGKYVCDQTFDKICDGIEEDDEPAGCEFCRKGVSVMFQNLGMDSDVLDMEMQALGKVCNTLPDPKGCMKGVNNWWPKIAATLFNDETAKATCVGLSEGKCSPRMFFNSWNCQTCQNDVKAVANLWSSPEALKHISEFMADGMFCKRPDLGLKPEEVEACQKYISAFLSPAMKVVMSELDSRSSDACNAWFNIC